MERASSILRHIGIFRITITQLRQLIGEIEAEQVGRKLMLAGIELKTRNSTVTYDNAEELEEFGVWGHEVKTFKLQFWEHNDALGKERRSISISGGKDLDNFIYVSGDDEGWVVGTADLLAKRMKRYEVWYSIFLKSIVAKVIYFGTFAAAMFVCVYFIFSEFGLIPPEDSSSTGADDTTAFSFAAPWIAIAITFPITLWLGSTLPTQSRIVEDAAKGNGITIWTKVGVIVGVLGLAVALLGWLY